MKKIITAMSLAFGLIFASAQTTAPATPKKAVEVKKVAKEKAADSKKAVETKKAVVKKVTKEKTAAATTTGVKLKKDVTPDKRYKTAQHLKKDGTPDKRFKENQK